MEKNEMTLVSILSFFGIMLALAAMPSASVALVVVRSSSCGMRNGVATALGIVAADLVFVTIAILGLSALALAFGSAFSILKYLGGAYLIWLGVKLLTAKETGALPSPDVRRSTLISSFTAGFLLTFGDLKAIFFYASLFPTLMDVTQLTVVDVTAVVAITVLTVGGVKLAYAIAARTIVERLRTHRISRNSRRVAGGLMIGTGGYIIAKS
jgi:threonine/homoserine/homoserine lactone efflux protein